MDPQLIELKQARPGFDRFIGSWFCRGQENILVDVGPARSVEGLVAALRAMKVDRIDYVLITHIHIDHAGGVADFLRHYPMARIICHEKGMAHLMEPVRLTEGSRKVLGDLVDAYGPIGAVEEKSLLSHREARVKGLEIIETPGHAVHHLSYLHEGHLFPGEAAGIHLMVGDMEYTRPATPPQFFLRQFAESMDRLIGLGDSPVCFSHWGRTESSHLSLQRAREQLLLWEEIIRTAVSRSGVSPIRKSMEALIEKDPYLGAYRFMEPAEQEREKTFVINCIEGYLGYLKGGA